MIAASTAVVDLVSRASVGTDQRLDGGADGWFLDHRAIDAGSCCAVVDVPRVAILDVVKK